ncbi:OLC1v1002458C4 [Oldenlandia corymbosa var. corymbosa]|uniref:OLC1v1002458C4 n=1 Tax=Oldenlandia corymbosa var. corymbosa TaxID=529605 RepID=A0AAV1D8V5_OLDCO|nr:OLC1v1002458C4 [Oldenlandia corymbosa var. corymbosa]
MDSLPDCILQFILSHINNAKDVASCAYVSKRWKDSVPYVQSLFFPRNVFDNLKCGETPDGIISTMVSSIERLEELVVYCPFTSYGLAYWLQKQGPFLRNLELRMDNIVENQSCKNTLVPSKMDCIRAAPNLESLRLWGVSMVHSPKWDMFHRLKNLEIVGAKMDDAALYSALRACPYLTSLSLLGCEGLGSVLIELPFLRQCKLDFYGQGNCSLSITSPWLELLEVQGCSWIKVRETQCLRDLTIANNLGRVYIVDFGKLTALESLTMRGVQWCWQAISTMLHLASEVKHLYMKVEFSGDFDSLLPFPEVDLVEFFNSHPKLRTFEIHGAMFAALCQKNSLKNLDGSFLIPCLEKLVITIRSPLNAEQKMNTLESLLKYSRNLKKMTVRILHMKSSHSSADDFFDEVCKFCFMNRRICIMQ